MTSPSREICKCRRLDSIQSSSARMTSKFSPRMFPCSYYKPEFRSYIPLVVVIVIVIVVVIGKGP